MYARASDVRDPMPVQNARRWNGWRARRTGAAVVAFLLSLMACGGQPRPQEASPPARVTPRSEPQRIISLVPAVTEMLFAMGAGPSVVAVSSFDTYPPEALVLPRVGALLDPDLERILALKPDLVVVHESQRELARQLDQAAIRVFSYRLGGLDNVIRTIRDLGAATALGEEAEGLAASIESRLVALGNTVRGRPAPATLLVFSRESGALREVFASGGIGFLHDILVLAGGRNVFGDIARESVQATTEAILAAAPEVIVELRYGRSETTEQLDRERRVWESLSAVPAVRNNRIYMMSGHGLVVPGPRVVETAERIARLLHPAAFVPPKLP